MTFWKSKIKVQQCKKLSAWYLGPTQDFLGSKGTILSAVLLAVHSSLSSRFRLAPLHSCYGPWQSFHGIDISQILGSALHLGFTFLHQRGSLRLSSRTLTLPQGTRVKFTPRPLQSWGFYFNWGCSFTQGFSWSLSAMPQLLSVTSLYLQNQWNLENSEILPRSSCQWYP